MKSKDQKIIEDAERENIPIFVFTAKDKFSAEMILYYQWCCMRGGCQIQHTDGIYKRFQEFEDWQRENRERVKLPD